MATHRELELLSALRDALEYIEAIPADVHAALPPMPGFAMDPVNMLIEEVRAESAASTELVRKLGTEYRPTMTSDVLHSWAADAATVLTGLGLTREERDALK